MKNTANFISMMLLAISGILLLSLGFSIIPESAHPYSTVNLYWFNISLLTLAVSTLFSEFSTRKIGFNFLFSDLLVICLIGVSLYSYNWQIDAAPEKLVFFMELGAMWFMLRVVLSKYPSLRLFYLSIMVFCGLLSIFILNIIMFKKGMRTEEQLLFMEFSNSSSYAAYLAFILPISLNGLLIFRKGNMNNLISNRFANYCFFSFSFIVILLQIIIIPVKNVWIAVLLSCFWVFWMRKIGWDKTNQFINKHKRIVSITSIVLFFIIGAIASQIYLKKLELGDNRILRNNVTTKAIIDNRIKGVGYGMFNKIFTQTQATYFLNDYFCETEKKNATYPENAGNEILQTGMEHGLIGLLFYILFAFSLLYYGIKYRHISSSAAIFALIIYGSYTDFMQFPTSWVTPFILAAITVTKSSKKDVNSEFSIIKYIGIIAAVIALVLIWSQRDIKSTYIKWHEAQVLYTQKKYKEASVIYVDLSKKLSHQSDFIYEAADCFYNISSYQISTDFLNRGLSYSSKSKLYHLMAKNKIMQGKYEEAEQHLIEAIQILPYSGENYYELIKFYSYPHSLNYEKLNQAVLTFNQIKKLENNNITYNMILDVYEICYRTNVPFSLYFENSDLNEQN